MCITLLKNTKPRALTESEQGTRNHHRTSRACALACPALVSGVWCAGVLRVRLCGAACVLHILHILIARRCRGWTWRLLLRVSSMENVWNSVPRVTIKHHASKFMGKSPTVFRAFTRKTFSNGTTTIGDSTDTGTPSQVPRCGPPRGRRVATGHMPLRGGPKHPSRRRCPQCAPKPRWRP